MKQLCLFFAIMTMASIPCKARHIPLLFDYGTDIVKIQELPQTSDFDIDYHHVDLGIYHGQFSIFGIPIWNYGDEKYVLYRKNSSNDYTYYELDFEEIYTLHELFDIPLTPKLPFWDKYGVKLLVILIIMTIIIIRAATKENS